MKRTAYRVAWALLGSLSIQLGWAGGALAARSRTVARPDARLVASPPDSTPSPADSLQLPHKPPPDVVRIKRHDPIEIQRTSSEGPFSPPAQLTSNGVWSWFGDPRAVRLGDNTYVGWVTSGGNVEIGSYNHLDGGFSSATLHPGFQVDDHVNPSILTLADGRLMAFYSRHAGVPMYYRTTSIPEDITSWGPAMQVQQDSRYTYPNPIRLQNEGDKIYLFWRGSDWKPTYATTTDGTNWSAKKQLLETGTVFPYVKYATNGMDRIHFAFTDTHPEFSDSNNVYHAYYENDAFYKADGTFLRNVNDLPLLASEVDKVYDAKTHGARGWIWDIALDATGNPRIVYAQLFSEMDHRYRYSRWNGTSWEDYEITAAGGTIEETGADPYYSAGVILDHDDPTCVYLSREIDGFYEIESWITPDGGVSWSTTPITSGSMEKNIRPIVPRNRSPVDVAVIWLAGDYEAYTVYQTRLMFAMRELPTDVEAAIPGFRFALASAHPVRGRATFTYTLPNPVAVRIDVYNMAGRRVDTLTRSREGPGTYVLPFDPRAAGLGSGLYFLRMRAGSFVQTTRIVVVN